MFTSGTLIAQKYLSPRIKKPLKLLESRFGYKPSFVILSTGRAGSTFTAELLRQAGVRCSHETFFSPNGFHRSWRYNGDSSWLAVPYLESNPDLTEKVIHQIRNPLDVISSLYGIGFFDVDNSNVFARFSRDHFSLSGDELIDCMRWWTQWNLRCEALASCSYLFENLLSDCSFIFSELGKNLDYDKANKYLKKIKRKKINSRLRREIVLSDLPSGEDKQKMINTARRYGYSLN